MNQDKLISKNFNHVGNINTIKRLAREVRNHEKFHYNVTVNLAAYQSALNEISPTNRGYIRFRSGEPFSVHLFSEDQLGLLKSSPNVLYLDATGNIVRGLRGIKKRFLLYTIVKPSCNGPIPVADMITSSHDTFSISTFLNNFILSAARHVKLSNSFLFNTSVCQLVVTDFSWAIIHSVLRSLVGTDIDHYLQTMFDALINDKKVDMCLLFICSNHFIHNTSRQLRKKHPKISKQDFQDFMQMLVFLMYTENFTAFLKVFDNMCIILITDCNDKKIQLSKDILAWTVNTVYEDAEHANEPESSNEVTSETDLSKEQKTDSSKEQKTELTIRGRSPFANFFKSRFEKIHNKNEHCNIKQKELLDYLLNHIMPLAPLWGHFVKQLVSCELENSWYSNAFVESWFASLKTRILPQKKYEICEFITSYFNAIHRKIKIAQIEKPTAQSRKRCQKEAIEFAKEEWAHKRSKYVKPAVALFCSKEPKASINETQSENEIILTTKENMSLTRFDKDTLKNKQWISDNILLAFIKHVAAKSSLTATVLVGTTLQQFLKNYKSSSVYVENTRKAIFAAEVICVKTDA